MNKTQVISAISQARSSYMTTPLDELKIVLHLLHESPYLKKYEALENSMNHIRGIISVELETRNILTQKQLSEVYDEN